MSKHGGGKTSYDRVSLNVKVAEHFIGPPASEQPNPIIVSTFAHKRAMAPDEHNERTGTSVGESPTAIPQQLMTCHNL